MATRNNVKQYGDELSAGVTRALKHHGLDETEISTALVAVAAAVVAAVGCTESEFLTLCKRCYTQAAENRKRRLN